jgi:bacterioferritin-associated ferredoxin
MYVCVCNGITEREVRGAIRDGATTMRQLCAELPLANRCGRCGDTVREMLDAVGSDDANTGAGTLPAGCAA